MNIDPNGRMPPRQTITAGSINLPNRGTFNNNDLMSIDNYILRRKHLQYLH